MASGEQIERIFQAENFLQTLSDRQLLGQRLVLSSHHRLEHQFVVEDGRWVMQAERLYATLGVPFAGNVDPYIANVLAGCDGRRTLREVVVDVATRMRTDLKGLMPACLTTVRKLMQAGFLHPVGGS